MTWTCAAIDHGITFYQNGTIAPCWAIDHTYRKPIANTNNDPFADLRTGSPPDVCQVCHKAEHHQIKSLRQQFNSQQSSNPGYQFIDIRNSNFCNYKCRSCYPGNSSQWAQELGHKIIIVNQELATVKETIVSPTITSVHYTGGEPFINKEFWELLQELVDNNYSNNISLSLNTNLSTLKYKNIDIFNLFKCFKNVNITCSIDAVGEKFNYIRSGGDWKTVEQNLYLLKDYTTKHNNLHITIGCTVSILNIWFIEELLDTFNDFNVELTNLNHPAQLSLTTVPDSLKSQALECIDRIATKYKNKNKCEFFKSQVIDNSTQYLFKDTVIHTLLLDKVRDEKLFDLLPFKQAAMELLII